jgi:hypothetical protein
MTKNLKTLLLVSAICLSVSACAHKGNKNLADGKPCKMLEHVKAAGASADNAAKELSGASDEVMDAKKKKHFSKLVKEAETLSKNISKAEALCEVKHQDAKTPVAKKAHAKAKAKAAKVAPAAVPATAAEKK